MRRWTLLAAGAALWLFLAIPAMADGGPHVSSVNSGSSSLTADSCAGCHRAHSAKGESLIAGSDETALCLSCHNGSGATTNVVDGVQKVPTGLTGAGTDLGALRDGGFVNARIGATTPGRLSYPRGYADSPYNTTFAVSTKPKVPAMAAGEPVTSAHMKVLTSTVTMTGRMWGSGASGLGMATVTLNCAECHNPHGNNTYRILKSLQGTDANPLGTPAVINVKATYANASTIVTETQHGLVVNDAVTLTNVGGLTGTYYVFSVVNGFTFTVVSALTGTAAAAVTTTTTTGTVSRPGITVADSAVDPDGDLSNPTKNYTILQTKGVQGFDKTFLLYARDVVNALGGTGLAADQTPVAIASVSGGFMTTATATGVAVGDLVDLAGVTGIANGTYTVSSIQSNGAVYNQFKVFGQTATGVSGATVTRKGIAGQYGASGGDYFRRTVPWNAKLVNSNCDNTIVGTSTNGGSAFCATMNDAPNGRPGAIQAGTGKPTSLVGQQAFVDQMSTWCAQCHTRYYSSSNENTGSEEVISSLSNISIATIVNGVIKSATYVPTSTQFGSPSYGDKVSFAGTGTTLDADGVGPNTDEWFVLGTSGSSPNTTFTVSATLGGTAVTGINAATGTFTKVYQSSNSSWGYPRNTNGVEDANYKYQHSTSSNRACTVCHVAHGSNAVVTGQNGTTFSKDEKYPDGVTTSLSSRLLKVDNRGTCQMCHDPTSTITAGTYLGVADQDLITAGNQQQVVP